MFNGMSVTECACPVLQVGQETMLAGEVSHNHCNII